MKVIACIVGVAVAGNPLAAWEREPRTSLRQETAKGRYTHSKLALVDSFTHSSQVTFSQLYNTIPLVLQFWGHPSPVRVSFHCQRRVTRKLHLAEQAGFQQLKLLQGELQQSSFLSSLPLDIPRELFSDVNKVSLLSLPCPIFLPMVNHVLFLLW